MKKVKTAIFGAGFMGKVHSEAIRRLGNVEVVAVAALPAQAAKEFAASIGVDRSTDDYRELLADPQIEVVHICAPNHLHFTMATDALKAGKHVICEKPLATSIAEGEQMVALAKERGLRNCTFHNIRFYPQVQNMRRIIEAGDIGEVWVVQGTYSQDWLLFDTDWNWRVEAKPSRTFADIGTHWCDLTEFVTGLKFTSLCSHLHTFHKFRKKPKGAVETFASASGGEFETVPVETEDFGSMLFRLGEKATGAMTVSQVAAGRKNRVFLEVFGSKGSVVWNAESQEELWMGHRGQPNQIVLKDLAQMKPEARKYVDLPAGHSEGFDDTFKQLMRAFYHSVTDPNAPAEYPTFEAGLRQLRIIDTMLESAKAHRWVDVKNG